MSSVRVAVAAVTAALLTHLAAEPIARAGCPDEDSLGTAACRTYSGMFMPSAAGVAYVPLRGDTGPWLGGGAELVLFGWSSNSDGFGPSQGKIRLDIAGLGSPDGNPAMVMYRGGVAVSFEGNAGRSWLIPYFGGAVGGMHQRDLGGHAYADAELGLYLVYLRHLIVDAEGSFLFPFTDFEALAGPKVQLTASFALW